MNRGKEPPMSLCERKFLLEAIKESKRLDGRETYDYRDISISLGKEPGHVEVTLGGTRVFACVTCQVSQPKPQRPTDGHLYFNVELSPMASPAFEVGKPSSRATEVTRILERCLKDSRAIDTESLCIIAGEKVWDIRIDVHVLDHCGNIVDCACIAAITALKHARRPDVTVIGETATVHPITEREPVPLSVHHMPLCFTFSFFHDGEQLVVDPTRFEESVMNGNMVVGMNIHREICVLQMTSGVAILPEQVLRCTQIAAVKCAEVTKIIKQALSGKTPKAKDFSSILETKRPKKEFLLSDVSAMEGDNEGDQPISEEEEDMEQDTNCNTQITKLGEGTAELGGGGANTWELIDLWSADRIDDESETKEDKSLEASRLDSEEEETVVLKPQATRVSKPEDLEKNELERSSKSPHGSVEGGGQEVGSSGRKRRPRRGKRGAKQDVETGQTSSETSQTRKGTDSTNAQSASVVTGKSRKRRQKK